MKETVKDYYPKARIIPLDQQAAYFPFWDEWGVDRGDEKGSESESGKAGKVDRGLFTYGGCGVALHVSVYRIPYLRLHCVDGVRGWNKIYAVKCEKYTRVIWVSLAAG